MTSYQQQLYSLLTGIFITSILYVILLVYIILKPCDSISYYLFLSIVSWNIISLVLYCLIFNYSKNMARYLILNSTPISGIFIVILMIVSVVPSIEGNCIDTPIHPLLITYLVLSILGELNSINNYTKNQTAIDFLIENQLPT